MRFIKTENLSQGVRIPKKLFQSTNNKFSQALRRLSKDSETVLFQKSFADTDTVYL